MDQMARFPVGDRVPVFAVKQLIGGRFIEIVGAKTSQGDYPAEFAKAGARAFGVAERDTGPATEPAHSTDRRSNTWRPGSIARVECEGEVDVLDEIEVGAEGKAKTHGAGFKVGKALTAGKNSVIEVELY